MKVSTPMMYDIVFRGIDRNYQKVAKYQEVVSSGKKIRYISEDPVSVSESLIYRRDLSSVEENMKGINEAKSWLVATEGALSSLSQLLTRMKTLAISQATGTANEETRKDTSYEVENIASQIRNIAATRIGGKHIFSGYKTDVAPFSANLSNTAYYGDSGEIEIFIENGVRIKKNVTGDKVFVDTEVLDIANDLRDALQSNDVSKISEQIGRLDNAISKISAIRADIGARINRVNMAYEREEDLKKTFTEILSNTTDADMTEAVSDLSLAQVVLKATLSAAAKSLQTTLLDLMF